MHAYRVIISALVALLAGAAPAFAQQRGVVLATAGLASIGHADSEQGTSPIVGGSGAVHLTPRFLVEADIHRARVEQVFGREFHTFTALTFTGSVLYRSTPGGKTHFLAGGGIGWQRARIEFELPDIGRIDRTEVIRMTHGRAGLEWDVSKHAIIRTEGGLWFGPGVDWVLGGRIGLGWRF